MSSLRYGMVTVTLMVCVVVAAAGYPSLSSRDGVDNTDMSSMDATGFMKGVISELTMSDEQRGRIFDGVMRISDAPVADGPAPDVADSLP
jgi:hypothetical protein